MEQRPLRLGDIVDDYCPRERRITNHAIVAIVEQSIRQTRCTTCDAEHAYKDGKVPRRRKKDEPDALYEEVLTEVTAGQLVSKSARENQPSDPERAAAPGDAPPAPSESSEAAASNGDDPAAEPSGEQPKEHDLWPAHRTLIRATLPRIEGGEPPPRPIPEFTMHQRNTRGGNAFRHGQGWPNGNGQSRNGFRQGRHGGQGHGQGQGSGPPSGGGRHGRHRNRHKPPK